MICAAKRTLAEALGDNNDSLYRYLRRIANSVLPPEYRPQKDDFIQDFLLLQIQKNDLSGLNDNLLNGNINENPVFRAFLGRRLRGYLSHWTKNQVRRIEKPKNKPRPREIQIDPFSKEWTYDGTEEKNGILSEDYVSFQAYQKDPLKHLPEGRIIKTEIREKLFRDMRQAMEYLKPGHRRALELRFFEGATGTEIAEELGVSHTTARSRVQWGVTYLRESIPYESRELFDSLYGKSVV